MQRTYNLINKYEQFKPFTDSEAWGLFRLAAIAEAVGWTLLIFGILLGQYIIPGNTIGVKIAGRIHGMLFLAYILAVIVLYPSQSWSRRRTLIAALASVPPYGSLIFEQWAARKRTHHTLSTFIFSSAYHTLLAS